MSYPDHPYHSADQPPARGSVPVPPPPPPAAGYPAYPTPMGPSETGPPTIPMQPGGRHDQTTAPGYPPGSATPPAPPPMPGTAPLPGMPGTAPGSPGPAPSGWTPMSGPPGQPGLPALSGPPGPPGQRRAPRGGGGRKTALVLLSVATGLLLVGGGVLGYLWWSTSTELTDTRTDLQSQVEDLTGTVESRDSEIDRLGDDLQQAQDELSDAQTDLEGTENMVSLLEEQQDAIRRCIVLASEVNAEIEAGQDVSEARFDEVDEACAEADKILGF